MTTFLRLQLASSREAGNTYPPSTVLINVAHITRMQPTYNGTRIILDEPADSCGLTVTASLNEIQAQMHATNGRIMIKSIGHVVEHEHQVDATYEAARADLQPSAADVADWGDTDDKLRAYYGDKGI